MLEQLETQEITSSSLENNSSTVKSEKPTRRRSSKTSKDENKTKSNENLTNNVSSSTETSSSLQPENTNTLDNQNANCESSKYTKEKEKCNNSQLNSTSNDNNTNVNNTSNTNNINNTNHNVNNNTHANKNFNHGTSSSNQKEHVQQHQYVEVAKGFTIKELNKKSLAELYQIALDLNIPPNLHKRPQTLIMHIMHEQIRRAGGYAAEGVLDILEEGYGFLRTASYSINEKDVYVSPSQIRRFDLRTGDIIIGQTRAPKEGEKFAALLRIEAINFEDPESVKNRKSFDSLTPYYPNERFILERKGGNSDIAMRIIDLLSPVGKGQRGLIVAPPKAGKTTLLKSIANSIIENHPEVEVLILLIDERPEEVTDMQRSVDAEVISSTFDEPLEHHIKVSELTLEKAKRMVENDKHVVILLDSITRLARAYNLYLPSSGQTLTGGVNPVALYKPKKFFGAARNIEGGGSLTILATALIETGSKLDDIIFEEFKGTGNMELVLDRRLFEKRLFPCIDIKRTGTRKEELLLDKETLNKVWILRKVLDPLSPAEAMQLILERMSKTKTNKEFLDTMHISDLN